MLIADRGGFVMRISMKLRTLKSFLAVSAVAALAVSLPRAAFAAAGDAVADRVLGQPSCYRSACNTLDPEATNSPNAVAIDKSVSPNRLYIADTQNNRVLGYSSISSLVNGAPATLVIGQPDLFTGNGGIGAAGLSGPKAVAVDKLGNLYVADTGNNRVLEFPTPFSRGIAAGQAATMVWGQGLSFNTGQCNLGLNGFTTAEGMCQPSGVAVDSNSNLFVADTGNNRVLAFKVPFDEATDANEVFGQNGSFNTIAPNLGSSTPSKLSLNGPTGLAIDAANNLYIADTSNNRVLKFNTPLTNTAASLSFGQLGGFGTGLCNQGTTPSNGTLCGPVGITLDSLGNLFIGDTFNNRVLMFKPPFAISPLANFVFGQGGTFSDTRCNGFGSPSNATLCQPEGLGTDASNSLWIGDYSNNRVLRYAAPLSATSVANLVLGQPTFALSSANRIDATVLCGPTAVAIDKSVTPNHLWVVDTSNNRVLGYTSAATFATYSPANIVIGQRDFFSGGCNQNGPASNTTLCTPNAAVVDGAGNLFVADAGNNRVLEYKAPFKSGIAVNQPAFVVFGQGGNFTTTNGVCPINTCPKPPPPNGNATPGGMCLPSGVAIDQRNGNLYVSDENNNRILRFTAPFTAGSSPLPSLVLGQFNFIANYPNRNNTCSFIFPRASSISGPDQIAVDALGNLYVADTDNSRVLEYTTPAASGAAATMVYGQLGNFTGEDCNLDSDYPELDATSLCFAEGVAADSSTTPTMYIADTQNNRVLRYRAPLTSSVADLVIGQPTFFNSSCNFGGSTPTCKTLCQPLTPAVDSLGNLYIPDAGNNRVLEYDHP